MANDYPRLAKAENRDNKTALHLLAQSPEAFANKNSGFKSYMCTRNINRNHAIKLVKFLWDNLLNSGRDRAMNLIVSSKLLFDATKIGNSEFLYELLNSCPDLIWQYDSQNWTIIHYAVLHRHANIYNVIHAMGPIKEILTTYVDNDGNNLLHLAAKLPLPDRLNTVSGPALQMQRELLWFQEVKRIVQPLYAKKENNEQKIPEQLFRDEHEKLRQAGEKWMKTTATSCMLAATLIATVVFTAAFTLPGGNKEDTGVPNKLQSKWFKIFVLTDGLALIFSLVSIIMFLSILTSRYAQYDFHKSLPWKLMMGLVSLFLSVASMLIVFCSTIFIACYSGLKWVTIFTSIISFVPIVLFVCLQSPFLFVTFRSTCCFRTMFKPARRVLY